MGWLAHSAIQFFFPALKAVIYRTDLALFSVIIQVSESLLERLESLAGRAAGDSLRNLSWDG